MVATKQPSPCATIADTSTSSAKRKTSSAPSKPCRRSSRGRAFAFAVGASRYGVADLAVLAEDTHKFEARYLDTLIGPYPEASDVYAARSPLFHADGISCPVILLQGLDDKVVPPNQAESMLEPLAGKGIRHEYVPFEGEGHGFRKAESIVAALEAELAFFGEVLGFEPASDRPEP